MNVLHETTRDILKNFRLAQTDENEISKTSQNFLGRFFADPNLTDEEIQENILNFLLAGRDTTAVTLTWAVYFISRDDSVRRKILAELSSELEAAESVTFENHSKLKYLEAVVCEY